MTRTLLVDFPVLLTATTPTIDLGAIDLTILAIYVVVVVAIGFALKRYMNSSADFLTSGRSIPAWVTGLAFISANLGALELVGMAASGAKYGMMTCHFYWIGAILAMVFLAVFMMPFYYGSKARSVPEYLNMRFDGRVRTLNSVSFAVMTVFASGISMNELAKLLEALLGLDYHLGLWLCSGVVLLYVLKGGLTSAIYTEVLQFFMIILGFAPVVYLGLKDVGGYGALEGTLKQVAVAPQALGLGDKAFPANAWTSTWDVMFQGTSANPMGVDWFGMMFGLGFVLAFGYWCTNFLVVQRAMAAKNMSAARRTPLIGAIPKMLIPALVILPGMIAVGLASAGKGKINGSEYHLPRKALDAKECLAAVPAIKDAVAKNPIFAESAKPGALPTAEETKAKNLALKEIATKVSEAMAVQAAANATAKAAKEGRPAPESDLEKLAKSRVSDLSTVKLAVLIDALKAEPAMPDAKLATGIECAAVNDYSGVIVSLVQRYCPPGLLGLALTALLASFMSGMAGNVTAFNAIWTYDIYQAYLAPNKTDDHYLWMGRAITVVGIVVSIGCAYFAKMYNNAMDVIQLVFGFVNAPLFATFMLGMFSRRTTPSAAFFGLFGGIGVSAAFHGLTVSEGKGGWLGANLYEFPSTMAQNFWLAAFSFIVCLVITFGITLVTKRTKTDAQLAGLVYSLTPKIQADENEPWIIRPAVAGTLLIILCVIINLLFW